jgi:hypothetical protein
MRIALAWAFVGALGLANTACEHEECDEAVKLCRADFGDHRKAAQIQAASMDGLKTALARLQAKVQWPTEGPANPLATRASRFNKDGVGKTAERQAGVAKQTPGSNRT